MKRGERDFSFSHLFNIAEVLGVDISDLLTGESPKLHGYMLPARGQGSSFTRRQQYEYHHLAYNFRDKLARALHRNRARGCARHSEAGPQPRGAGV